MTLKPFVRIMSVKSFALFAASLAALALQAFDTPYLTFRSEASFTLSASKAWDGTLQKATSNPADGSSWSDWTGSSITAVQSDGQYYIYLRGTGNTVVNNSFNAWTLTGSNIYCEGDIETLRGYDGNAPTMAESCYKCMFQGCTALKSVPTLSETTVPNLAYYQMFQNCTSLEINTSGAGVEWSIPNGTTGDGIWNYSMFEGTSGSFTDNPVVGTTYYVASALPFGQMYQKDGSGTLKAVFSGYSVSIDLTPTIRNGAIPYTFALASGTLPPGLEVSGATLSGTPTTPGAYDFTMSVEDAEHHTLAAATYHLLIVQRVVAPTSFVGADGVSVTTNCVELNEGITTWDEEWYVVNGTLNYGIGGVTVSGNVNLVLADGSLLSVTGAINKAGINVAPGNSLAIYAQAGESGTINASGNADNGYSAGGAGIGGNDHENCGTVTINGGVINAYGGNYCSAGIGGGCNGAGGTVTINGGTITAIGGTWYGAGIGGGYWGAGGNVSIKGGTITATAGSSGGVGIGKGYYGSAGTLTVGAAVCVKAGYSANPTTELAHGEGGVITVGSQRYFYIETLGMTLLDGALDAYTNENKTWDLNETIVGGATPYSFSGTVPAGLTLTSGGTLSGAVDTAGTYPFTLTVTDAAEGSKNFAYTLTIADPDPLAAEANLGTVKIGKTTNINLANTVSGGVLPYTFAPTTLLPAGFTLSGGVLSAEPTAANSYSLYITVTDKLGTVLPVTYTLTAIETAGFIDDDPDEPASGVTVSCRTPDGVFPRTCNQITSSDTTWENSWYYVNDELTLTSVTVVGKVSLVLGDNAALTVNGGTGAYAGIQVTPGNTLTIYVSGSGTGSLVANGGKESAGIGGNDPGGSCGKVTIYGGNITAKGGSFAAGIGGADDYGNGGTVAIYGGTVVASAGSSSAGGIGKGWGSSAVSGTLTVGDSIVVKAGSSANPTTILAHGANGEITLTGTSQQYFVVETTGPAPLAQTTSAFDAYTGEAASFDLATTVSGGTSPYSFALKTGELPSWLSLSGTTLSGTPTASGETALVFTVTDSATGADAQSEDFTYTITVAARPKSIIYKSGETTLTGLVPSNYVEGVGATLPATAIGAAGYSFAGWYDNDGLSGSPVTAISDAATGPQTFWASWTATVYTVTYMMDSTTPITDQGLVPTSYTVESETLNLPATATKAGKGFYGWYTNSVCTGDSFSTIPHGSTGNKTFYAKWGAQKVSANYVAAGGTSHSAECAVIGSESTALETGWYVVNGAVTILSTVTVSGDVNLILADGANLVVTGTLYKAGINVVAGNSLTIYGQAGGTGRLEVNAQSISAGIGGSSGQTCGAVTINGGVVESKGSAGAGIGCGYNAGGSGSVTVNGGTVTAVGINGGAGIGGGAQGNGFSVAINGGTVTANSDYGAGIGAGSSATGHGSLTVGANVVVKAGSSSALTDDDILYPVVLSGQKYFFVQDMGPVELAQTISALSALTGGAKNWTLADTIKGGTPPYSFAVKAGAEPPSFLSLSDGVLSGTPAAATVEPYAFTIVVTDDASDSIEATYTLTVVDPPALVATQTALGSVAKNTAVNYDLARTVTGGILGYTFAEKAANSLPSGLSLTSAGVLSGTPAAAGEYAFTVVVSDSASPAQSIEVVYSLVVKEVYSITYYSEGSPIVHSPSTYVEGTGATLPTPSRTGFTFKGWHVSSGLQDAVVTSISSSDTGNKVFYAEWEEDVSGSVSMKYIDADGVEQTAYCTVLEQGDSTLSAGRYVVYNNISRTSKITISGDVELVIKDGASLDVTVAYGPAIEVKGSAKLTIYGQADGTGALTAKSTSMGPAIGSNDYSSKCGTIIINGGVVTATGNAAGIGGGSSQEGGTVVINGGTVIASGGMSGCAGIGGGYGSAATGSLTVGEYVTVTASDNSYSMPVKPRASDGTITLGGERYYKAVTKRPVSVAYIDADGTEKSAICTEVSADCRNMSNGWYAVTSDVNLGELGMTVSGSVNLVLVDGASLVVTGAFAKAGINVPTNTVLTIYGQAGGTGALYATGSGGSAGIGGNSGSSTDHYTGSAGKIVINGGVVVAVGQGYGTGIGGGGYGNGGDVTVNGGDVTATGGSALGMGIGQGGWLKNGGSDGVLKIASTMVARAGTTGPDNELEADAETGIVTIPAPGTFALRYFTVKSKSAVLEEYSIIYYKEWSSALNEWVAFSGLMPNKYSVGEGAELPSEPNATKTGYTFAGWYTNSTFTGSAIMAIPADATGVKYFYAKWAPNVYDIVYIGPDGETPVLGLVPSNYTYSTTGYLDLATPSGIPGYTFGGWYTDPGHSQHASWVTPTTTGTQTFYGKWTPTTYTITYKDGDDTISGLMPTNFTIESSDVILPSEGPEREGYTFGGWTLDAAGAGEAVAEIPAGSYGDKTFYVKWVPIEYPITYMDGASPIAGLVPTNYTAAAGAQLPVATKQDSFFIGWYTNSTFTGSAVTAIPAGQTGEKTFYARWSSSSSVTFIGADGVETSETCAEIAPSMTTWNSGWYVVVEDTTIDSTVTVSGDVNLVLADDVTLTVAESTYGKAGILVPWGHSLTIYGQQRGTGALIASGGSSAAGIGGCREVDCGRVVVNGGIVTAKGGNGGAGIGGGNLGDGGDVFLNGGLVTAYGGGNAPGIGAGFGGALQGTLTLGENVTLDVSEYLDSHDPTKPADLVTVCVGGEVELYGDMRYFRAEKGAQASPLAYLAFTSQNPFTVSVEDPRWDGELRYSMDAVNWILWDGSPIEAAEASDVYALYFRGTGNSRITSSSDATRWVIEGSEVSCIGDVETLRDWRGNPPAMGPMCFSGMFKGCSALVSAPMLSRMSLAESCYAFMFQDCVNLMTVPPLPATHLGSGCYNHMFDGCTSLRISESAPGTEWSLPDEVRTSYNIENSYMFQNTSGSFTGSPTNSVYYIKGANDLDMPIQRVEHIYATGAAIAVDLRDTLVGGSDELTFAATANLPEGLSLDAVVLRGALATGHVYPLGIRVTDGWFEKSVDLSYTLHTVAEIPVLTQTAQSLGPYGAYILADSSLTNTISGSVGTCKFVETPGTQNKIPSEIQLVEDGRFYINGELDAGTYTFDVTVTDGALRSLDCTYALTITENAPAVIDGVTPMDDLVTIYGGEQVTFSVTAHDPEGQAMVYYWYMDGAILGGVGGLGPSYTYSYTPRTDGSVEKPTRTLTCRVWDRHSTVIAKSWTISQPGWRYEISTDALPAATTDADYSAQLEGVGHGGEAEWHLAEGDRLPPGLAMGVDGVFSGRARMAGSYAFTVLRVEGNAVVSKEFTIKVTGANATATTFGPLVDDIGLSALVGQTIPGDRIEFADGAEISTLDANDFPGVTFSVPAGTATFAVNVEKPLDAQNLVVAAGAHVVFKAVAARPYFGHYDLVQMPATMAGNWSVDAPFFLAAAPAVDSDGVLGFDALGGKGSDDTLTILFPDGPDVRDHELADFATTGGLVYRDESSVDGASVLGSMLTLGGDNSFGGAVSQVEGNTAIVLEQGASLDIGSVYELGGALVFEEGTSFKFAAQAEGTVVSNAVFGGMIVPPSSGTANLVLKEALVDGESLTVFDYYTGSEESFRLVLPDGADATHYSLVCEDGRLVIKCGAPLHEGDSGTMTVTGGNSFEWMYGAHLSGNMVTASGGTAPYTWTCPFATYAVTRAGNSFDGSSGAAELAIRQRLADSTQRNVIGLGFDFPFGGYLQNQVAVGLNGCITVRLGNAQTGRICVFGTDASNFATVHEIFVSRSATTATIRFGQRVSVTLVSDGTIRVAYGPLAEGAERRYMPCDIEIKDASRNKFVRVARFEAENGEYNGIGDAVFTQTSAIPGGLSPSTYDNGIGLSGILSAPAGSYPVKFRCIDANGYMIEKTVTVNVIGENSSLVKSTATVPAAEADGTCHIQYGDSRTFSVAGIDPSMCRWYEDDTQKASGVLSYTFDSSTGPRPLLSTSYGDFEKHTKLVTCRVLDPLYAGQEQTVASWQVIVNVTYHIDASVVDSAADGTEAHPFRTVPTALYGESPTTGAFPGDVFLFRPGKYKVPFEAPDGFAVTLRSTGGADATLITVDDVDKAAFVQKGAEGASRAATVEGFTLVNAGGRAAYGGTFVNCVLRDSALAANHGVSEDDKGYGGGAYGSRLVNCLISNCSAVYGGGVANCELRNCTVVCNYADELGGALDGASVAYNTVFWGNRSGSDDHASNPTERTPVPGYILPLAPTTFSCLYTEDPMLYADGRPAVGSPCLGAGNAAYLATDVAGALTDLAGDARNAGGTVSIGAYENAAEKGVCRIMVKATGAGTVLEAPYADVEYGKDATFRFRGRLAAAVSTNGVIAAENVASFVWPNVTQPGELSVTFTAVDLYVDASTGSYENDGLSWDSPKLSILDAVNSAGNGDVIHVKPGRYGSITVTQISNLSDLTIVSTEGSSVTIVDAQHIGSCFDVSLDWIKNAEWERHGIVLEGFTLQNGRATGYLGGGGACGGTLIDCVIQNCESIGQYTSTDTARGGGTSGSVLKNCIVRNCRAGKSLSDGMWYSNEAEGGGVWGGYAEKCEIYGNSCWGTTRSEGPGAYETVLRDCYVYNNKIGTLQERETVIPAADAALNVAGEAVEIRVETREPTTSERNDDTERIPVGDAMAYDSKSEAETAALKQLPDITLTTASRIAADKIDTYTDMFEIKTVQNADTGKWENTPAMKASVEAELREDLTDALSTVATAESLTDLGVGVTEITLTDPKPGLYYAMEFCETLGGGSAFTGPRYLSDGHSVKLYVEHHDTPSGFWRMSVYTTPTGE